MTLLELNAEIDQISCEASACPDAQRLLAAAWWFCEDQIREENTERLGLDPHDPAGCSMAAEHNGSACPCCRYYRDTTAFARNIRRLL